MHKPYGLDENIKMAKSGGQVANNTRKDIEMRLGKAIVTQENMINYQYNDNTELIEKK